MDLPTRDLPPEGLHLYHLPGQGHGLLPMAGQAGDLIPTLARTRCYRPGSGTLRQMAQPSSFSSSLMSATTGVKPRLARSWAVRGADAAISTRPTPSVTTWQPTT